MNAREELVERLAIRRREKIGGLSDQGFEELVLAVRENPAGFVDSADDEAFLRFGNALDALRQASLEDEFLDEDAFQAARTKRLANLVKGCDEALAICPDCLDAQLVRLIAQELDPDPLLEGLMGLDGAHAGDLGSWDDVFSRPKWRLRAAMARTCADGARFKMAGRLAASLLGEHGTADPLGARHTLTIVCVRLEDEAGFDALDVRFSGHGDAWSHLGRALLLFKLDRLAAARRALRGYDELCQGGAYALLRPTFVELYLPDRPEVAPCSFDECLQAARETEPVIADTPDFIGWCQGHDWLVDSATDFAQKHDLDW